MKLAGMIAVVTGGGGGIGRAIATRFAREGAGVLIAARTERELKSVLGEIEQSGGRGAYVVANVSRETDCQRVIAEAQGRFGRVDILVNNAGDYGPVKPIEEITAEEFDAVVAAHLRAAFVLTRLVLPKMYERRQGVILNISSISAKAAFPWGAPYAAAKAGMLALTRIAAAESARKGVRVNAICPGPVTETRMSQELGAAIGARLGISAEAELQEFLKNILQGRGQTAAEIAAAAAFLASEEAAAITGQSLNVDGGAVFY